VHKRLIADHALRLYPGSVTPAALKTLRWGVAALGSSDYKEVQEKEMVKAEPKTVGFEGLCDPATGFFCKYDGGKIVGEDKGGSDSSMGITGGKKSGEKRTGL
jgi:hypothetical protein